MTRDELIDMILDARTIPEINATSKAVREYQEAQPELDAGVAMACEQMAMIKLAIEAQEHDEMWSYTPEQREADEEAAHSEEHHALAEYLDEQGHYHSEWCDIEPWESCPECVAESYALPQDPPPSKHYVEGVGWVNEIGERS